MSKKGLKQLREQREITISKWRKVGLLEGLVGHSNSDKFKLFESKLTYKINENELDSKD